MGCKNDVNSIADIVIRAALAKGNVKMEGVHDGELVVRARMVGWEEGQGQWYGSDRRSGRGS